MSTRSNIIVQLSDGKFKNIYCHFDGYLEGVGATLQEHYNSQERAEALVAPGDISSLAAECTKPDGHSFDNRVDGYTVYYGRDRGEEGVAGTIHDSLSAAMPDPDTWAEFIYVWQDGRWFVGDADKGTQSLAPLDLALKGIGKPHPNVKAFGMVIGRHN